MRIAIPVWENRVSPLFDSAGHILLADGNKNKIDKQEILNVESLTLFQRIDLLQKLKVNIFICGGITRSILETINNKNIKTIPFVCGDIKEIILAALKGKDVGTLFAMPGQQNRSFKQ